MSKWCGSQWYKRSLKKMNYPSSDKWKHSDPFAGSSSWIDWSMSDHTGSAISWLKQQSLLDSSISRATNSTCIKPEYRITRKNIGFLLFTTVQASEILGTGRDTEACFVSSFAGNYGFYSSWIYSYLKIKCNLRSEVIMFKNTICVLKIWAMLSFIEEHGQMKWGELIKQILL